MTDWRAHDDAKNAWVRARLKGAEIGPLERHQDRWRWLVEGDALGGWPVPEPLERCSGDEP